MPEREVMAWWSCGLLEHDESRLRFPGGDCGSKQGAIEVASVERKPQQFFELFAFDFVRFVLVCGVAGSLTEDSTQSNGENLNDIVTATEVP
jgi:hypothetical protein